MPVEIKELVIRATIEPESKSTSSDKGDKSDDKKLQQIADEILKKINQKNER